MSASSITLTNTTIDNGYESYYNSLIREINVASNTSLDEVTPEEMTYSNVNENLTINRTNHNYGTLTYT